MSDSYLIIVAGALPWPGPRQTVTRGRPSSIRRARARVDTTHHVV